MTPGRSIAILDISLHRTSFLGVGCAAIPRMHTTIWQIRSLMLMLAVYLNYGIPTLPSQATLGLGAGTNAGDTSCKMKGFLPTYDIRLRKLISLWCHLENLTSKVDEWMSWLTNQSINHSVINRSIEHFTAQVLWCWGCKVPYAETGKYASAWQKNLSRS